MSEKTLRAEATFSGAKRWMNCPASVALSRGVPEEEDQSWKDEGNKAHEEARSALENNTPLEEIKDAAVKVYVDYVRLVAGDGPLVVEKRLSALGTSGGIDCYCLRGRVAHLFDFKYGRGVRRRAEKDAQLAGYAVLIRENHPEVTTVIAHMIQPNLPGEFDDVPSISSWTLPWQTIKRWRNDFSDALDRVERGTEVNAGPWCQSGFCKAVASCPAYLAMVERARHEHKELYIPSDDEDDEDDDDPMGGTGLVLSEPRWPAEIARIASLYGLKKFVTRWFDKAELFLLAQLKAGVDVPGYMLGKKRSNRVWSTQMSEEEIAAELIARGVSEDQAYKPRTLIPLTQAEKLADISGLTEKPEGGDTIKPIFTEKKARKKK